MPDHLVIHVDGGSRGNPGPAGAGVTIRQSGGETLFEAGFYLGEMTNNMAEYHGLLRALEAASAWPDAELTIHADSELMVRQLTGRYRVKNATLHKLFEQAQMHLLRRDQWQIVHVRRAHNDRADALANRAMDERNDVVVVDRRSAPIPSAARNGRNYGERQPPGDRAVDAPCIVARCKAAPSAACPAPCAHGDTYEFVGQSPEGVCLDALGSMLNTVLALRDAPHDPEHLPPALTVRCFRAGCGAAFEITVRTAHDRQ